MKLKDLITTIKGFFNKKDLKEYQVSKPRNTSWGGSQSASYNFGATSSSPQINQLIDEKSDIGKDLIACAISNGWIKSYGESTFIWRSKTNNNIDLKEWWIWNKSDITRYRITDIDYRDYKLSKLLD